MRGKVYLGRYEVQKLLGEGGMGKVYLARQLDLSRSVVVKVMHEHVAADAKFRDRFQREMILMARFQHPYAVTLHDAALHDADGPCIVMEYVRGEALDALLKKNGHLSPFRVGRLLGQLCEVLQEAHNQGIIHRDLKPSNLMVLDADTPFEKIKVMDFGLAKLVEVRSLKQIADSGSDCIIGTPAYMCPEQTRGEELDHRSDLYSVGVMLYEVLTGRLPFDGLSTMDTLLAHAVDQPPHLATKEIWVPSTIEAVVHKALSKNPNDRYASARDLYLAYEEALRSADQDDTVDEEPEDDNQDLEPPPVPERHDPNLIVFQLQAWMPEAIAAHKLRGFMQDVGAEVIESVPGMIRVLLGGKGCAYQLAGSRGGWLGLGGGRSGIEMELRLCQVTRNRDNTLWITVILRHVGKYVDKSWRIQADQIYRDLRAYLMGTTAVV